MLKIKKFSKPFNEDNSEAKFYLYHSTEIAKAGPGFDDQPEHPSVQINSSSPCSVPVER